MKEKSKEVITKLFHDINMRLSNVEIFIAEFEEQKREGKIDEKMWQLFLKQIGPLKVDWGELKKSVKPLLH